MDIVTLVFTDIQDSSELWERHGSALEPVVGEHDRLLREVAGRWGGVEVKYTGDGFLFCFADPTDAVRCCTALWATSTESPSC